MIILIRSVVNKNKNKYYYNIFLEKGSYNVIGIDVNKTSASKESDICHYWHFLNYSFKFRTNVCNRCHDLVMMSMNLSDIAVLNIKVSDYCCIISLISKNDAINLLQNAALTEKSGRL